MDDQPMNAGAATPAADPGASAATAAAPPASSPGTPDVKECVYCGEVIPGFADRCSHCSAFLPIAEGRAFGHHFFFFVCCLAIFLGTLLPWEGQWYDSYGTRSIHGAFLLLFSGYGMVAFVFNVFHKRMIVWPAILGALDGAYAGWKRVFQITTGEAAKAISFEGDMFAKKRALAEMVRLYGPGLWLVVLFSTMFWLVFVLSVIQGGRAAGARKEAEKAARAARKK